jgi:hypothetical protein
MFRFDGRRVISFVNWWPYGIDVRASNFFLCVDIEIDIFLWL